jgi:hypothetical protein
MPDADRRVLAVRTGAMDVPGGRRIHRQPTARFGGVALFASMILGALLPASIDPFIAGSLLHVDRESLVLIAGASAILIIGIVDDIYGLSPALKMALEIAIAASIAPCGYSVGRSRLLARIVDLVEAIGRRIKPAKSQQRKRSNERVNCPRRALRTTGCMSRIEQCVCHWGSTIARLKEEHR